MKRGCTSNLWIIIGGENSIVSVSTIIIQQSIKKIVKLYADDNKEFPVTYPFSYAEISHQQHKDKELKRLAKQNPSHYCIQQRKFSVLNNDSTHTSLPNYHPQNTSETPFPRTQASNDTSPCSHA